MEFIINKGIRVAIMRPTELQFRAPRERTAEFKYLNMTNSGINIDFKQKTANISGNVLPKEPRFLGSKVIDKGSG